MCLAPAIEEDDTALETTTGRVCLLRIPSANPFPNAGQASLWVCCEEARVLGPISWAACMEANCRGEIFLSQKEPYVVERRHAIDGAGCHCSAAQYYHAMATPPELDGNASVRCAGLEDNHAASSYKGAQDLEGGCQGYLVWRSAQLSTEWLPEITRKAVE